MGPYHLVEEWTPDDLVSPPQLLQVAIVCAGHNSSRDVITLVKSMLFYRYSQECPFCPLKVVLRISQSGYAKALGRSWCFPF